MKTDHSALNHTPSGSAEPISLVGTLGALPDALELTTGGFAALVGTSANHITDRARTGVLRPSGRNRLPVVQNVRLYCDELRAAAGRHGAGKRHPGKERLVEAQARLAELKLAATEGRLLDAAAVTAEWSDVLRQVRAGVLAAPGRIGARLGLSAADVEAVAAELRDVLATLADDPGEAPAERRRRMIEEVL